MVQPGTDGLLEREAELSRLSAALQRAAAGAGEVVSIEGPPGIGKTALLAAARALASECGMRVLDARGGENERDFSYGVVRHLFEPTVGSVAAQERERVLSGAARHASSLFGLEQPAPSALNPRESSFTILHGLFWLTANLAHDRPLLLAIDDLHWCDPASLRFVDYLAQRLEGLPIALAATLRPNEPDVDSVPIDSFAAGPLVTELKPHPLSGEGSAQVVRTALSPEADAEFCRSCHDATGGNPLLLRELTRAMETEGVEPTSAHTDAVARLGAKAVSRTVALRLARLGAEVSRFAEAAAVLGDGTPLRSVAALAGLGDELAYEVLGALSQLDILRPERTVEFVHPLVRAAVHARLRPAERERTHARAARILADAGEPPERVASHLLATAPTGDETVVSALREAARRALGSGEAQSATAYLRRALEEPPPQPARGEVLFELGSAESLSAAPEAVAHLAEARELTEDPYRRTAIAELLATALVFGGEPREAVELGEDTIEELGDRHPELRRRLEAAVLSTALDHLSLNSVVERSTERARRAVPGEDFGAKALDALLAWKDAWSVAGPASEVAARAERALAGGLLLAEDTSAMLPLTAAYVLALADSERAPAVYGAAIATSEERGSVLGYGASKVFRAQAHIFRGAISEALADVQEGLHASETFAIPLGVPVATGFLAEALIEAGELEAAYEALAAADPGHDISGASYWVPYRRSRARLLIERGELRAGLAETLEAGRQFEALGASNPADLPWRSRAALCLTELGEDPDEAQRLVEEELDLARRWGAPRALGVGLRAAGLIAGGEQGLALLHQAVELLERSPAQLELARALTDLGAALRRANRRSDARARLRRGMDLAHRCGARSLEDRARAELRATGARPRRALVTGVSSLTPSERRVAGMAADGHTNREIAQKLFVTPKTVETHLGHAYHKLEVRSRSELVRELAASA